MTKKILLVDDEPDALEIYAMRLEISGYEVITTDDGEKALEAAKRLRPDLIVLDLMLPKIEGYDVCRILKFDDDFKNIPIVILSALSQSADRQKAVQAGANSYFVKPVDFKLLIQSIEELLS